MLGGATWFPIALANIRRAEGELPQAEATAVRERYGSASGTGEARLIKKIVKLGSTTRRGSLV